MNGFKFFIINILIPLPQTNSFFALSVSVGPGLIALKRISSAAYSIAKDFINPDKASLREVEIDLPTPAALQVSDNIKTTELILLNFTRSFFIIITEANIVEFIEYSQSSIELEGF